MRKQKTGQKSASKVIENRKQNIARRKKEKAEKIEFLEKNHETDIDMNRWWDKWFNKKSEVDFDDFTKKFNEYMLYRKINFETKTSEDKNVPFESFSPHFCCKRSVNNITLLCFLALGFREYPTRSNNRVLLIKKSNFIRFINSFSSDYIYPIKSAFQNFIFNFFEDSKLVQWFYYYPPENRNNSFVHLDHLFACRLSSSDRDTHKKYQAFTLMIRAIDTTEVRNTSFIFKKGKIYYDKQNDKINLKDKTKAVDDVVSLFKILDVDKKVKSECISWMKILLIGFMGDKP